MSLTLADAIANAYLFAGDAKTDSKGLVRVLVTNVCLYFYSYDDYMYLAQRASIEENSFNEALCGEYVYVDKKDLKAAGEEELLSLLLAATDNSQGTEELFESLSDSLLDFPTADLSGFTFPSDRWSKLSRIKGDEPCVIELGCDQGMKLAAFTKGPGVQGLMAFLEEGDSD